MGPGLRRASIEVSGEDKDEVRAQLGDDEGSELSWRCSLRRLATCLLTSLRASRSCSPSFSVPALMNWNSCLGGNNVAERFWGLEFEVNVEVERVLWLVASWLRVGGFCHPR